MLSGEIALKNNNYYYFIIIINNNNGYFKVLFPRRAHSPFIKNIIKKREALFKQTELVKAANSIK